MTSFRTVDRTGLFITLLIFVLLFPVTARCVDQEFWEKTDSGFIDWSNRKITAAGLWETGSNSSDSESACEQARKKALDNLLKTALSVRIREKTLVRHLADETPEIINKLKALMASASFTASPSLNAQLDAQPVESKIDLSMDGAFSELILPSDIRHLESVHQVEVENKEVKVAGNEKGEDPNPKESPLTGLVVDARGLEARPALVMRVLDEGGEAVYGTAFVSREFVVDHGMAAYLKDMDAALSHPRVAQRPLVVKGIKTWGVGRSDIVISNFDAAKLKSASEHLTFLRKCRVIIVTD